MIDFAAPTESADHPLLPPHKCAILTEGLWPLMDDYGGQVIIILPP